MQVLRISKKHGPHLCEAEVPAPRKGEVLVKVMFAGICGSDLRMIRGEMDFSDGIILGHEFSGRVAARGKNATKFRVGQMVMADPTVTCGRCVFCASGKRNLCSNLDGVNGGELGVNMDGAFAEYVRIRESNIYPLPRAMRPDVAALAEPLACVLNGFKRIHAKPRTKACVIGLGPTGMLWCELFRKGSVSASGIEISEARARIARKLGFDGASRADSGTFDYVVDTTGSCMRMACDMARPGGKVVLFGMNPSASETIVPFAIAKKDLDIHGVNMDAMTFTEALAMLKQIRSRSLITNILELSEYEKAFRLAGLDLSSGKPSKPLAMKVLLCP